MCTWLRLRLLLSEIAVMSWELVSISVMNDDDDDDDDGDELCTILLIRFLNLFMLQKDASSALAHSGAHLDLSAFSSPEVGL